MHDFIKLRISSRNILVIIFAATAMPPTFADSEPLSSVYSESSKYAGHNASARQLMLRAEMHMKSGANDLAITELQNALKAEPDDVDARCLYALALQHKIDSLPGKTANMDLLMECANEWLRILRSDVGEEKDWRILGFCPSELVMRAEYRTILAKRSLRRLTGLSPRPWETNERFLKRVQERFEKTVSAKVFHNERSK